MGMEVRMLVRPAPRMQKGSADVVSSCGTPANNSMPMTYSKYNELPTRKICRNLRTTMIQREGKGPEAGEGLGGGRTLLLWAAILFSRILAVCFIHGVFIGFSVFVGVSTACMCVSGCL